MTAEMPAGVTVLGQPSATRVPVAAAEGCPHLILTCGGKTLKRVVLDGARLMVGRSDHNDLKVVGEWISRQHAIFIRHGGATVLLDLKSRNGTYVNGDRIGHKVVINNDVIDIGDHRIKFIDPSAKHRMSLRGAGFDETTIKRSIKTMREVIARRLGGGRTG